MKPLVRALRYLLGDISHFSGHVLRIPLRDYQREPLLEVIDSIVHHAGREYLLVFPRQSGKNEAVAHLLVYLLNLYRRAGGAIVYGATGDGLGLGIQRLEQRLENPWNAGQWRRRARPDRRILGNAAVVFLSTSPQAASRGHTAHILLVIDETQDQAGAHIEAVFTPMRAAHNATALYIGTVRQTHDYLWQKKRELEQEELRDGRRRVFLVTPDRVTAENPSYRAFLDAQVARYGRRHPIVASEYFLEPIDAAGGLFDARRLALMRGSHPRRRGPQEGDPTLATGEAGGGDGLYVATLDVAGEDEASTDPVAQLANPARDYTVATIFQVVWPAQGGETPPLRADGTAEGGETPPLRLGGVLPVFRAVDVLVDHGSRHFQEAPGRPPLVQRLAAWLEHWQVAHLVADQSGVGLGVVSWLTAALGQHRVTGFCFSPAAKAALGSAFLALVETGRFRYWCDSLPSLPQGEGLAESGDIPLSDAWWFFRQAEACAYDLPANGAFDRDLRWGVPAAHRTCTPSGAEPTHDDRLISAALVAEIDRLFRAGRLALGAGRSAVIHSRDPLQGGIY